MGIFGKSTVFWGEKFPSKILSSIRKTDSFGNLFIFGTAQRAFHRMKLAGKPDSDTVRFTFVKSQGQFKKT